MAAIDVEVVPKKKRAFPRQPVLNIETAQNRDPALLTVEQQQKRDRFVDGLLLGMTRYDAAIYSGSSKRSAHQDAMMMYYEPYTQERFRTLRETIDEEKLITRKELILNLKTLIIDERQDARARIAAGALVAKIMGYEAPTKSAHLHLVQGGVMLVPVPANPEEWEAAAMETQTKLKESVRQ